MDKKAFLEFFKSDFLLRGFQKKGNTFYLPGKDLLCGIVLQKSNYGNSFYVNYYFWLGNYQNLADYPTYHSSDIEGRFCVLSKSLKRNGNSFSTPQIRYEDYNKEELCAFFDSEFKKYIFPAVTEGKAYIKMNLGRLYHLTLNQNEVMRKLMNGDL